MSNLPLDNQVAGQPANDAGYAALMAVKPGERLRKARQERKLDVIACAEQLNLSESVLRALEKDDYKALPSSTFIKGYIRSYARMLRLPGDDLVRAFEYQTGVHSSMDEQHPVPDSPTKKSNKMIPSLFAALVVAAGVGWLMVSGEAPEEAADVAIEPPIAEVVSEVAEPVEQALPLEQTVESAPVEVEQVEPQVAEPEVVEPVATEPEVVQQAQEQVAQAEAEPVPESAQAPTFQFDNQAANASSSIVKGNLVMAFSDDCWVEIRDQNQRLVHADLHRAGSRYSRQYPEPFDVKLGNGNAVEVFYNGSPVVYARSQRSNVARFTIGERADTSEQ